MSVVAEPRPVARPSLSRLTSGPVARRAARRGRLRVGHHHHEAGADIVKAIREQPGDEVAGRVVDRRRPDVRLATDRGEQDQHLGQAPIEGVGHRPASGWPRSGSRTVPGHSGRRAGSASPRSRSSRLGIECTRASCSSSRRIVAGSTASARRSPDACCVPMPERYRRRNRRDGDGVSLHDVPLDDIACPEGVAHVPRRPHARPVRPHDPRPGRMRRRRCVIGPEHRRDSRPRGLRVGRGCDL